MQVKKKDAHSVIIEIDKARKEQFYDEQFEWFFFVNLLENEPETNYSTGGNIVYGTISRMAFYDD